VAIRLAIDIGGTFTDLAAHNTETGKLIFAKSPTTPHELTDAIVDCFGRAMVDVADIDLFIHGTTVGINTIIERKGPATALITTRGFRDVYEMGRRNRPEIYDLLFHRPRPLVPRDRVYEVTERVDAGGQVLIPLVEDKAVDTLRAIGRTDIVSIAVCLLHSYANPTHERQLGRLIERELPEVSVSVSSDIHREYREYERTSTAVINAYLRPVVGKYLDRLEERLGTLSFAGRTLIMQSSGGVMSLRAAATQPVRIIESGPAGGVAGTLWLCSALGYADAIAFDMGGTTAKACLIQGGRATVTSDYHVGGRVTGHPAQVPFLDIIEIGAGGGSTARVDSVGALKVGPDSAGAVPGPACYGHGGTEPTVTDANLLVGKLDPLGFLGGEMQLDVASAEHALTPIARRLDLDARQAANGILRIANAMMAQAVSKVTVERGYDPRDFVMFAYGGAGPMHATAVARELGIRRVVIPRAPAEFSALGMLTTDIRYDYARTYPVITWSTSPDSLDALYAEIESAAREELARDVGGHEVFTVRSADMRYLGQFHTLSLAMPDGPLDGDFVSRLEARFHAAHDAAYGHSAPNERTEIISLRVAAFVHMAKPEFTSIPRGDATPPRPATRPARVVLWEDGNETTTPVYQREMLLAGNEVAGPAMIQEMASVVPLARGERATVDELGNLHIVLGGG